VARPGGSAVFSNPDSQAGVCGKKNANYAEVFYLTVSSTMSAQVMNQSFQEKWVWIVGECPR
jgi:hypothetical protein